MIVREIWAWRWGRGRGAESRDYFAVRGEEEAIPKRGINHLGPVEISGEATLKRQGF